MKDEAAKFGTQISIDPTQVKFVLHFQVSITFLTRPSVPAKHEKPPHRQFFWLFVFCGN